MQTPRLTLMRTPFVKRHTPPLSGLLLVVRFPGTRRRRSSVACPDVIAEHRCPPRWLPHTRMEALSPLRAMAAKCLSGLSAAEQSCCPLIPSSAQGWLPVLRAPVRARFGRGAAHGNRGRLASHVQEPERASHPPPWRREACQRPSPRALTQSMSAVPRTGVQAAPMGVQ